MRVAALGATSLCPHTMYRHSHGTLTDEYWLEVTLDLLRCCNAIFLLKGWEQSEGSVGENVEASTQCLTILTKFHEDDKDCYNKVKDFIEWWKETVQPKSTFTKETNNAFAEGGIPRGNYPPDTFASKD